MRSVPALYTGAVYIFSAIVETEDRYHRMNQNGPFTFHDYLHEGVRATGDRWTRPYSISGSRELIRTANGALTNSMPNLSSLSVNDTTRHKPFI